MLILSYWRTLRDEVCHFIRVSLLVLISGRQRLLLKDDENRFVPDCAYTYVEAMPGAPVPVACCDHIVVFLHLSSLSISFSPVLDGRSGKSMCSSYSLISRGP